jgi:hypothetical protein
VIKKYLIQSSYGFIGWHQGFYYSIVSSGLNIWTVNYDGTPESLGIALVDRQRNSDYVKDFEAVAPSHGIPIDLGRWLVFSVIDSWEDAA